MEQVTQLKKEGLSDQEISQRLQQQGISPKEINDAFSRSSIRNAISNEMDSDMIPSTQNPPTTPYSQTTKPMEDQTYTPQTQEDYSQENYPQEQYEQETYYPQQEPYAPSDYAYSSGNNTNSIIEIAEQVFVEKTKEVMKKIEDINEFKIITQTHLEHISERLKRMEEMFDNLQIKILDKVGRYGKDLETTKKEVEMIEDSFQKIANPLLEKSNEKIKKSISKK